MDMGVNMKANILFTPIKTLRLGMPAMAEVAPNHYLDSYVVGYCADKVYLDGFTEPFERQKVTPYAR